MKKREVKSKHYEKILIITLSILLLISILINLFVIKDFNIINPNLKDLPELSLKDYSPLEVEVFEERLVLKANCYAVIGTITQDLSTSINDALNNNINERPNTHDSLKNILNSFNIKVIMVKVTEIRDKNFLANLYLVRNNKIISLDIKPSDAIALALRVNAPIYINNGLLKEYGTKYC